MELVDRKKTLLGIFLLGILIPFLIFNFTLNKSDQNISNFLSLLGTYVSLFGLSVAYYQIVSVKEMTASTKTAVDENARKISQIMSVSELSKATGLTELIQQYLLKQNYQPALLRMQDLKAILVQASYIKELDEFTKSDNYEKIMDNLSLDLNNLAEYMLPDNVENKKKKINSTIIYSNVEIISTTLLKFVTKLKVGNDT